MNKTTEGARALTRMANRLLAIAQRIRNHAHQFGMSRLNDLLGALRMSARAGFKADTYARWRAAMGEMNCAASILLHLYWRCNDRSLRVELRQAYEEIDELLDSSSY